MTRSPLAAVLLACLAAGVLFRLFPLVAGPETLARFFITEDGYLLLTVARNLALGNGLAVSDGEILTNGVQPLVTFLFALPYLLTGGDKTAGLAGVVVLSTAIAVLGAWQVRAFAARVLGARDPDGVWALFVTAFWFLGPLVVRHTMNALETGLYVLMVLLAVRHFMRISAAPGVLDWRGKALFGGLLGLVFLTRNDAALLIFALLLVRLVHLQVSGRAGLAGALGEVVPVGLISVACAVPWLVYNYWLFGSIVPISGLAQSLSAGFADNLPEMPVELFETMLPMLPLPGSMEALAAVQIAAAAVVTAVLATFLVQVRRAPAAVRAGVLAYALYAVLLVGYYSLFFGAPHFLSRYFAPLGPLLVTAAVWVGLDLARRRPLALGAVPVRAAGLAGVALSLVLLGRLLVPGVHQQGHFQVVEWVRGNLAPETWVGAVQTGTLGYWHDRTINLDGKVNPHALRARMRDGHVLGYVVDSEIRYLADWPGIATWAEREAAGFARTFRLRLNDPAARLAVLERRERAPE